MLALLLFVSVAIAAAFKKPRTPLYWVYCLAAVAWVFLFGPLLFRGDVNGVSPILTLVMLVPSVPVQRVLVSIAPLLIYGGGIGFLLLAIRHGRGTLRSPGAEEEV